MSALTDLFTSLASKIRVKLGTTDKYTPTQAIAAIDQIYEKGVASAKVGTATATAVLKGKTFTNASSIGATGTMPDYSTGSRKQVVWGTGSGNTTPAMRLDSDGNNYTIAVPKGYWNWSYDNSSITIPTETKTWTPAGATTLTPTDGKMIKSVTVNAVPTTTVTVKPSTSTQSLTPPTGNYYSQVTVNAISASATTVTAGTATTTASPASGSFFNKVTVKPTPTTTVTVTPTTSTQSLTPPDNYHFSKVTVKAVSLSGNAKAAHVLDGETFYTTSLTKSTGTMPNKTGVTKTLNCGASYTIPKGYYDGTTAAGVVTGASLKSQTGPATGTTAATAGRILTGYSAWINGSQITGTMTNHGSISTTLKPNGSKEFTAGYHSASTFSAAPCTGTYTYGTGSTGAKYDMGAANVYRYVVATNVYNKGIADAGTSFSGTFTLMGVHMGSWVEPCGAIAEAYFKAPAKGTLTLTKYEYACTYKFDTTTPCAGGTVKITVTNETTNKKITFSHTESSLFTGTKKGNITSSNTLAYNKGDKIQIVGNVDGNKGSEHAFRFTYTLANS